MPRKLKVKLRPFEGEPLQYGTVVSYDGKFIVVELDRDGLESDDDGIRELTLDQILEIWSMP